MWKTDKLATYPDYPNQVYCYTQGTELRDPSIKETVDYFARLLRMATAIWPPLQIGRVLNEIDIERQIHGGLLRSPPQPMERCTSTDIRADLQHRCGVIEPVNASDDQ
jgi:hypothetical protein